MATLKFLLYIAVTAIVSNASNWFENDVPLPTIDLNEWWGPDNETDNTETCIEEYKITFDEEMICDLKSRLLNHRPFKPPLKGAAFTYGFSSTALEYSLQYLANKYDFSEREKFLNQYPHYRINIQGLNIHYMRITAEKDTDDSDDTDTCNSNRVPLLLLHGWPGSIREFYDCIPFLLSFAKSKGIELDIIAPSLPGYGFSDGAVRPGLGADKMAVVMKNMMHEIGYSQFYVQAGDFGALIAADMATLFPNEVLGYHTNFPLVHSTSMIFSLIMGNYHKNQVAPKELLNRIYPSWDVFFEIITNSGYLHLQATRPDTLGIGLDDSPSALISYIGEKFTYQIRKEFINYTDGGLYKYITEEQFLDNIMIYWSTNSMTTAIRLYAETFNKRYVALRLNEIKSHVPCWVLQAPDELVYLPAWLIKQKFPNLLGETLPEEGGHFYALEQPESFAQDVVNAIVQFRGWHAQNSTLYSQCSMYIDN